jgi:hypothetical protein
MLAVLGVLWTVLTLDPWDVCAARCTLEAPGDVYGQSQCIDAECNTMFDAVTDD